MGRSKERIKKLEERLNLLEDRLRAPERLVVPVKLLREKVSLPAYQVEGDACLDLEAAEATKLPPGKTTLVQTGLAIEVPLGWEAQVRSRSGMAKKGITVANSPGTVDSGYRGEVGVLLRNNNPWEVLVSQGDRVAQLAFCRVGRATWTVVGQLSDSTRGEKGFGSTGIGSRQLEEP